MHHVGAGLGRSTEGLPNDAIPGDTSEFRALSSDVSPGNACFLRLNAKFYANLLYFFQVLMPVPDSTQQSIWKSFVASFYFFAEVKIDRKKCVYYLHQSFCIGEHGKIVIKWQKLTFLWKYFMSRQVIPLSKHQELRGEIGFENKHLEDVASAPV